MVFIIKHVGKTCTTNIECGGYPCLNGACNCWTGFELSLKARIEDVYIFKLELNKSDSSNIHKNCWNIKWFLNKAKNANGPHLVD